MQNPYQQDQARKSHMPHLQKRIYPGVRIISVSLIMQMADQSFDTVQASSQDKYFMNDGGRQQTPVGYTNPYPETAGTPHQQSIDQRLLSQRQSSQTELFNQVPGQPNPKIESDAMPRPLRFINAYNYRAGIPERFPTKNNEYPPSAGIPFIQIDEGQVGPKYMRGTVIQAPMEQDFQKQSNIPFGFLVQPLAEMTQHEYNNQIPDIPLIDYDTEGPFRCYRCKAYVNPNMVFMEGGNKAMCNLCQFVNDVPVNYQSALNEFGQRRDRLQRPELQYGAYEFKAPPSYMTRKALNPTYVFVIDVSQFSLPQGFFQQIVQSIKMTLDYIPNPETTTVCFMTYDINIHFYSLPQDPNGEPNILWIGEIQDPFIPYPKERLMLRLVEDRERIDIFLDKLLTMHNLETKKYQAPFLCTGAALSAAKQLIADEGGRILVFASNISSSGFGNLMYREDPKLYNTDKEKVLLSPVNDTYSKMAEECIQQRICVDLIYAINTPKSIDLTSIAPVATLTGGDLHLFSPYDPIKHGEKLHYEIFRILTRNNVYEVAIKARTSTGLTVTEYFGGFGFKEAADFELAGFDSDKTIGFVIRNDEKLKEDPTTQAFVQFAIMYCTFTGEKRIRVFNYNLLIAKNLNAYYKAADQETLSEFMIKHELSRVFVRGAKATRETMTNNLVNLLYVYRQKCAAKTPPSQMVLPENLKLLPLYTLTAFKNPALRMFPGVKIDDKVHWVYKLLKMGMNQMPYFLYPRIYRVTDVYQESSPLSTYAEGSQFIMKPQCSPATMEKLNMGDAFLIDNGEYLFLYLGNQVDDLFVQSVFGYANFSDMKFNAVTTLVPSEELPVSQTLWAFVEQIRYEKIGVAYQPLRVVYAGDAQEKEMIETCLVEDSVDINKEFPYTEFLCMLHKLIRNKSQ